ncbi:hypothetical protein [Moraxella lacunata]
MICNWFDNKKHRPAILLGGVFYYKFKPHQSNHGLLMLLGRYHG